MKNTIIFLVLNIYFCSLAQAKLEGDYELLSGASGCPVGSLQTKVTDKKTGERVLLFGSRHSWEMNANNKSEMKEEVENGCHYITAYELTEDKFISKTTRSKCPSTNENEIIDEEIVKAEETLTYNFSSTRVKYKCMYKKVLTK